VVLLEPAFYIVLAPVSMNIRVPLKACFIQSDHHNQENPGFQQDTVYFTYIIYIKDSHIKKNKKLDYLNFMIWQFTLSSLIGTKCCSWVGSICVSCSGGHVFRFRSETCYSDQGFFGFLQSLQSNARIGSQIRP
jgi:hypothetical protein